MKHFLLKTWLIALMLVLGASTAWADEVTYTFKDVASEQSWSNSVAYTNVTLGNFTFTVNGGGNNGKYYTTDTTWRFYDGGGLAITPAKGYTINSVTSAPSLTFNIANGTASTSFSATVKLKSITINYTANGAGDSIEEGNTSSFVFNTDAGLSALGITKPAQSVGTELGSSNYTSGAITMAATNGGTATRVWNSSGTTSLRVYKNGGSLTFSGATITKIEFNSSVAMKANVGTLSDRTWKGNASSVTFTATENVTIGTIVVTYTPGEGGGGDEGGGSTTEDSPISNFIKSPTLSLEVGANLYDVRQSLNLPSDYPEGSEGAYNITTTIDGLTQKDGEFACVYPYLAFQKAGTYTVTVTAAAVPGKYAETTGTITVTVTGGTTPEPEVTVYESLADLVAVGKPTADGRNVTVTLTDEVITGIYTTSGGYRNGIFLKVGEQEIELYCKNVPETWEIGGTVSGTLYKCPWKLFDPIWELCPESWGLLTYTAPALQKLTITGEPKKDYYVGDSFSVAGLTVTANYANGTTLDVTDQVEWAYDPKTFTEEGRAIDVYVIAGFGEEIAEKTYTVSVVKNPYVVIDGFTDIKGKIDENVRYEAFKGDAANAPVIPTNTSYIRLYQNGGYITITGAKGVTISEVVLTTGSTYETTTIGYAVGDDDVPTTGSIVAKNSDFKVSDLSCNSISFYCLGTDSKSRIDIAAIKVKYTKVDINLTSISVAGEGVGKEFLQNSTFNHDGINVTAKYSDNSTEDVTASAEFTAPDMTTVGEKTVEVSYTEGGVTKTTSYTINVVAESITELHIATLPTKTVFKLGESFSAEGLSVTADYNSGRKNVELKATDYEVVAPSTESLGKKEVFVRLVANKEIAESYTVSIVPTNTIFFESFDTNDGTGGNDNQWSGSIASNNIKSDNVDENGKSTWTFVAAKGADKCARFGAGSTLGSAITPALGYEGSVTVSFKAAAWDGNSENTTITVSIEGDDSSAQAIELTKGAWNDYSVTLTGLTAESKVKFAASQASNNRFFLDEVLITTAAEPAVGRVTNYIEALKNGEEGYTLDGLQKIINDILQIKQ